MQPGVLARLQKIPLSSSLLNVVIMWKAGVSHVTPTGKRRVGGVRGGASITHC